MRLTLALLALVLAVAVAPWTPAHAQTAAGEDPQLRIRKIDSTEADEVQVSFFYRGGPTAATGAVLREDGRVVPAGSVVTRVQAGIDLAVAIVVDVSPSSGRGGRLERIQAAIEDLIAAKGPDDRVAIVAYSSQAVTIERFTADPAVLLEAVADLAPVAGGNTAIWDGASRAAGLLEAEIGHQPNIVLFADGADDASSASPDQAVAGVARSGAPVFVLDTQDDNQNEVLPEARRLVAEAGGRFLDGGPDNLAGSIAETSTNLFEDQYVLTYESPADQGVVDIGLDVDGERAAASFVTGSVAEGAVATRARPVDSAGGPDVLRSDLAKWLALALAMLATTLGVIAVIGLLRPERSVLDQALSPYDGAGAAADVGDDGALAQTALVQRAVELTEDFAERRGLLDRTEVLLERANLPLRAGEAMFFYGALVTALGLLAFAASGWDVVVGLGATTLLAIIPLAVVAKIAGRRRKKFIALLPDMLQLLAGSLRAGYSLMQGVEAVSREVEEPMGRELRRVVTEARLGRELEHSLETVGERMDSVDFGWAVMAIRIQREVGGNLAELLLTVSDTMTERVRLRREVAALTAEGKISAIVLGLLPIGLGGAMYVINRSYISLLFTERVGNYALGGSILAALGGFAWMKKIVEIEI
ncbi:hypothetical protein BH20ACT2_BH20ACT2_22710 [soil metagenome]